VVDSAGDRRVVDCTQQAEAELLHKAPLALGGLGVVLMAECLLALAQRVIE
jgi:hypothetical protein